LRARFNESISYRFYVRHIKRQHDATCRLARQEILLIIPSTQDYLEIVAQSEGQVPAQKACPASHEDRLTHQ
jgi:hypothetical protein